MDVLDVQQDSMHCISHRISSALLGLITGCGFALAHEDTPLQLKAGVLVGLPKVFQPAGFDLDEKILTISGKKLQLPPVLERLFPDTSRIDLFEEPHTFEGIPYDLTFSASWYHGPSTLPPYLQIGIAPRNRDFRFEILVNIQSLELLEAEMIVSLSPGTQQSIPIELSGSERAILADLEWQSCIGIWRSGSTIVRVSEDRIVVTDDGEQVEYPAGTVAPIEPGVMSLMLPDGVTERVHFLRSGDILELGFERCSIGLAKLGSATDKLYERLEKEAEVGAGQPANRPRSDPEGGDKPKRESEERSR